MIYLQRLNAQGSANKLGIIFWEGLHDAAYMTGNALDKLSQHGPFIKQHEKYWKYCIVGVCNRVMRSRTLVFRTFPTLTFKQVISAEKIIRRVTSPLDLASIGLRRLRHERQWPQKSLIKSKTCIGWIWMDIVSLCLTTCLPFQNPFKTVFVTTWSLNLEHSERSNKKKTARTCRIWLFSNYGPRVT